MFVSICHICFGALGAFIRFTAKTKTTSLHPICSVSQFSNLQPLSLDVPLPPTATIRGYF